ncbi:MAG TPA: pyridoxamine 5'-phosphate oxidase family protein [Thermoleophilaceae bacterium]|jgi:PPOX class probable FMN-dependent enzyme|nr:pyridoxamine 5'-phosphate oxidase family protein [Thermoleophilaceae bacterium]
MAAEHAITTVEQLRELYPPPKERSVRKELDHLDGHCREFIALSPFLLVASANAAGACDVSPKGGPPGFVQVLDDHRLAIPDATGNRRLDGLQNMIENPHVGLVFLIPGLGETLRVNGTVELTRDPALLEGLETGGKPPALALVVSAEQVYLHCAKCVIRSNLWKPESWPESLPSAAAILSDHIGIGDVEASAAALADSYANHI